MQANANTIRPTVADLIGQWPTAHWVRCHPDKTPVNAKGWQRQRLHADVVTSWAATGNPVAIIPGSVGYVALDVDAGDAGRMIAELPPAYACPSRRPGGMHLWYPHDGEPVGNRRWELFGCSGEVRGHRGYLILWNPDGLIGAPAHNATAWDVVENMIGRRAGSATPEVTHTGDTTDATGALDAIPADLPGYDNFLAVVIAAKASGIEAETVRTWTEGARDDQDGRRNKLSQWAAFWDGLTPTAIGPGTLFHFARQHGYTRPTNFWTTPVESSPEVGRDLLAMDWERCPTYAKFRLTDFRGGAAVKGWGCGEDPVCRRNKHRRDWGKPYAAGVGAVVTDVLIRGGFDMALGKGSPFSNLRNAHRAIRDIGAVAMLGPGFSQRVILAGVVDDLDAHLDYLRGQVGVKEVTATTGEPQTFAALYGWMGEREEWHYKKQRWRFYGWAVKKLPNCAGCTPMVSPTPPMMTPK